MGNVSAGRLTWHYKTLCEGKDTLIAFHGIGQSPDDWNIIIPYLSDRFTIYAFYLPHHGPCIWDEFQLTPEDFGAFSMAIQPMLHGKIAIMGHSIGARLAISMFLHPNAPYQKLILTAPDGIRDSLIYRFATRTSLGRRVMKSVTHRPQLVMSIAAFLKKLGFIPSGLFRFIESQYNTTEKAERIRKTWRALSWPSYSPQRMNAALSAGREVLAYFGKHDKVIRPSVGRKFARQCRVKVEMLEKGHNLLHGDRLGLKLREELVGGNQQV